MPGLLVVLQGSCHLSMERDRTQRCFGKINDIAFFWAFVAISPKVQLTGAD